MNKYLLMTAAALIGAATTAAGKANAGGGPYTIQFDGFCDGLTFYRTDAPPLATGLHLNDDCAGGTAPVVGTVNKKEFKLFETGLPFSGFSYQFVWAIPKPIRDGGEIESWVCSSGSCSGPGFGTYHLGCCDRRSSSVAMRSKVAEMIAQRRAARQSQ